MKPTSVFLSFSVFLASTILSGCASQSPLQLYPGTEVPESKVAVLRIYFGSEPDYTTRKYVENIRIDGKDITEYVYDAKQAYIKQNYWLRSRYIPVAILPGKHDISWVYHSYLAGFGQYTEESGQFSPVLMFAKGAGMLDAKAGKRYRFVFNYEVGDIKNSGENQNYSKVKSYNTSMEEYKPSIFMKRKAGYYETEDFTPYP